MDRRFFSYVDRSFYFFRKGEYIMEIIKIFNNNIALVTNERGRQVIVKGKGISFQKQAGDIIVSSQVEQFFPLSDKETFEKFEELLSDLPIEYLDLSTKIIDQAKLTLGKKLNESIYLSLADHIYGTLSRKKEGIELKNPLLWEIKSFYPDEYQIGEYALAQIKKDFDLTLIQDEAGFIALHLVNAESDYETPDAYMITKLMQELTNIVRYFFQVNFNEDSVYYYRFITHLKFFAQRIVSKTTYEGTEDTEMIDFMKKKYPKSFECVGKIVTHLARNYDYHLSDEECLYLTVHIQKVIYK